MYIKSLYKVDLAKRGQIWIDGVFSFDGRHKNHEVENFMIIQLQAGSEDEIREIVDKQYPEFIINGIRKL
ncbi:MAG: hypothetical protein KC414_15650 [Romboutsia sp.]|nr:hypothetical protein [Romboutsia sp.]